MISDRHNIFFESWIEARIVDLTTRVDEVEEDLAEARGCIDMLKRENEKLVFTVKTAASKMGKLLNKRMDCIEDKIRDEADLLEKLSIHDN